MGLEQMTFLVIVQDLRISGTSEGVVSRSFLGKLRRTFPDSRIEVLYIKNIKGNDDLEILPVNSINEILVKRSPPKYIKILNRAFWRIFNYSLNEIYILKQYRKHLKNIKSENYDHIFLRSAGQNYEVIRASKGLAFLSRAVINFHDPYPSFWDTGTNHELNKLEFEKLREMWQVVNECGRCVSPSSSLSHDMENLYGCNKKFYVLPHQYDPGVFRIKNDSAIRKRERKIVIAYHGAVQLRRNLDILIDAYLNLLEQNPFLGEITECTFRLKGGEKYRLMSKYKDHPNLHFLGTAFFPDSAEEQKMECDILIVLENCGLYSNILGGKAPLISYLKKPILVLAPERSEMRNLIVDSSFIVDCNNQGEIQQRLGALIDSLVSFPEKKNSPFNDYFSQEQFESRLNEILDF
jgi:glycosyltransferase involved in cell wall biosynthesis